MPLVNCPECGKQISDSAAACPHCGYPLSSLPPVQVRSSPKSTRLEEVTVNKPVGVLFLILAIIGLPFVIIGFIFGIIGGIILLIGVLSLFAIASNNLQGTRKGTCPYCEGEIIVTDLNASAMKCPHCKKRFAIKEDSLETLE